MPDGYKTSDGKVFDNEYDAQNHANSLAREKAERELKTNQHWKYYQEGESLFKQGKYKEAIEAYSNSIRLYGNYNSANNARPYEGRGMAYFKLGNYFQACYDFHASYTAYPTNKSFPIPDQYKPSVWYGEFDKAFDKVKEDQKAVEEFERLEASGDGVAGWIISKLEGPINKYGELLISQPGDDLVEQGIREGIYSDHKKAFKLFEKAAKMGNADGQCRLGSCFYEGKGVRYDLKKAIYWKEKAAEQGHFRAMRDLADFYRDGIGFKQDFAKAEELYNKAIAGKFKDAKEGLAKLK